METCKIIKEINFLLKLVELNGGIIKVDEEQGIGRAGFEKFPFEPKYVACGCLKCKKQVEFGIYENGGFLRGYGVSKKIKTSWIDGLSENEVFNLSKLFNLEMEVPEENKAYISLRFEGVKNVAFILTRKCSGCNADYILVFKPLEYYREKAISFIVQGIYLVEMTNSFIDKYVES